MVRALERDHERIAKRYGLSFTVVGIANGRDGLVSAVGGIDKGEALRLAEAGGSLGDLAGVERFDDPLEGLRTTEADVLVETSASPHQGEPGGAHMREALGRGIPVATSNKWPVARHGVALRSLAAERGVAFRAESTVMSGTTLIGYLTEGLGGATPVSARGVVNATANSILTSMAGGASYDEALARAQADGLAEPDPAADVDGHDSVAKAMILSGLVFGRQLEIGEVERRGISALTAEEVDALANGGCVREVTSLEFEEPGGLGAVTASVRPEILEAGDPLADIDGTLNCLVVRAEPLGEVRIAGPGAGPGLAGQGVLSDLIRIASDLR